MLTISTISSTRNLFVRGTGGREYKRNAGGTGFGRTFVCTTVIIALIAAALLILTAPAAWAAQPYTVHGYVKDPGGAIVEDATVSIEALGLFSTTGANGYYQISGNNFDPGTTYQVTASKSGLGTASGEFTVSGGDFKVDLQLSAVTDATAIPNAANETPGNVATGDNTSGQTSTASPSPSAEIDTPTTIPVTAPTAHPTTDVTRLPTSTPAPTPVATTTAATQPGDYWLIGLLLILIIAVAVWLFVYLRNR